MKTLANSRQVGNTLAVGDGSAFFAKPSAPSGGEAKKRLAARAASTAAVTGGLGTTLLVLPASKSARSERWELRANLRKVTGLERLRKCGVVTHAPTVELRNSDGASGFSGIVTCGSVWCCPACAAKIATGRREELAQVLETATARGKVVSMLTLTQRHSKGDRLSSLWDSLSSGWAQVTSGRQWQAVREQLGLIGWVRAVEVTHGTNGWHVHTHVLLITERDPSTTPLVFQRAQGRRRTPYPPEVATFAWYVAEKWAKGIGKHGVTFLADSGGLDLRTAHDAAALGSYLTKMGGTDALAKEATLGQMKKARKGNRTPFQIARDLFKDGDADDLDRWREWEQASHGRRQLLWSRELRKWAEIEAEKSDEELAAEEPGGEAVAVLDLDAWHELRKLPTGSGIPAPALLLDVLDQRGSAAALAWLDGHGIAYDAP